MYIISDNKLYKEEVIDPEVKVKLNIDWDFVAQQRRKYLIELLQDIATPAQLEKGDSDY